jgi:hypothetical protein
MTLIDRPARTSTTSPRAAGTTPAQQGGRYVSSAAPQPAGEGAYVTRPTQRSFKQAHVSRRGTYVTSALPAVQRGGSYTYSN